MDRKARIDILKGHIQVNVNKIGLEDNYIFSQDNNTKHDVYKFRYDVRWKSKFQYINILYNYFKFTHVHFTIKVCQFLLSFLNKCIFKSPIYANEFLV